MIDLRLGDFREVLQDVTCDALITDPPFGARTHRGHNSAAAQIVSATGQRTRTEIGYDCWSPRDVAEFVAHWSPRTRGWMACMTSDDLIPVWRDAYAKAGRLDFAPVGVLIYHPRLMGDGPGSGLVYLMVARPRSSEFIGGWSNPPWYGPFYPCTEKQHIGGKPLALMRSIVRDYSRPGDLVCDPCAGGATTLLAAAMEGRRAVGAELDPDTFAKAQARLAKGYTLPMFLDAPKQGVQGGLLDG